MISNLHIQNQCYLPKQAMWFWKNYEIKDLRATNRKQILNGVVGFSIFLKAFTETIFYLMTIYILEELDI